MPEQTLILVKPDGVNRRLVGEIISRFERRGLRLAALKMMRVDAALAKKHYKDHLEKPFYPDLETFITSGPIAAMIVEGDAAIQVVRDMMGATRFDEATPGTIRGDFAYSITENLVHGSDSAQSAAREIPLFFSPKEIL